jgi:polyisoprenoid-binding protein YceI
MTLGVVHAQEYHVDRDADNMVRFVSRTTIDEFDGTTSHIDGYVLLARGDTAAVAGSPTGKFYFEVDLASVDTGIGLRNRHMRENYLEVEQFPYAKFRGDIVAVDSSAGSRMVVSGRGEFGVHGVEREVEVACAVSVQGINHRARCDFQLLLSDYGISIPKVMFLKLANEIRVELDFVVKPAGDQ